MIDLINQRGSIQYVRYALRFNNSLEILEASLKDENSKANPRNTVVKMLEVAIRKTKKEASNG